MATGFSCFVFNKSVGTGIGFELKVMDLSVVIISGIEILDIHFPGRLHLSNLLHDTYAQLVEYE